MNALERLRRAPANRALVLLGGFTAFSVFGYWNFALHPERLPGVGWALDFFSRWGPSPGGGVDSRSPATGDATPGGGR